MSAVLEQHLGRLQVTVLHRERQRGAQEAPLIPGVHARRVLGEVQQELHIGVHVAIINHHSISLKNASYKYSAVQIGSQRSRDIRTRSRNH